VCQLWRHYAANLCSPCHLDGGFKVRYGERGGPAAALEERDGPVQGVLPRNDEDELSTTQHVYAAQQRDYATARPAIAKPPHASQRVPNEALVQCELQGPPDDCEIWYLKRSSRE